MVDRNGKPRRFFHGTYKDFKEFKKGDDFKDTPLLAFFSPDVRFADEYAGGTESAEYNPKTGGADIGGNIMPVYLKVENPFM